MNKRNLQYLALAAVLGLGAAASQAQITKDQKAFAERAFLTITELLTTVGCAPR